MQQPRRSETNPGHSHISNSSSSSTTPSIMPETSDPSFLWCLRVHFGDSRVAEVHGNYETLNHAFQRWEDGGVERISIDGICNSADRAKCKVAFSLESVIAMDLYRM